jgi:ABC-type transport system involved in Fe-S cluster assembly fused permease/ATPase subunit
MRRDSRFNLWILSLSRTQFRKEANAADNKGATVAVDSLINYEAVKVCTIREILSITPSRMLILTDTVTALQQ